MSGEEEGRTFGYARVSAKDQCLDRQLVALEEFGVNPKRIFTDTASGKNFDRPGYRALMGKLKAGDVLVIKSIDRLGRCYDEILEEWRRITKTKKVAVVVLDMPLLDTRERSGDITGTFLADIVLQLLSYVAQVERENIKQRQAEGIAAARARGVRFGRPSICKPECWHAVREAYEAEKITKDEAAEILDVSAATFDRWRKAAKEGGEHSGEPCEAGEGCEAGNPYEACERPQ